MNEWVPSHVCSTDVVPGFKGKGSAMAARSRTPTSERPPSPSWGTRMQEVPQVEEAPQISLAAHHYHQALLTSPLGREWSRQRAHDFATDAMRQLSHASNLVERVFYTPAEAEPWREGITFQERRVAEMVDSQLKDVIGLLNKLLGSLAQSEQGDFDASTERAWQEVCSGESPELRDSRAERECPPRVTQSPQNESALRECPPRLG